MNIKKIACAAAICGCVSLATAADEVAEAEKGEVEETPIVSAEFGLQLDSKYMTYGVVDGKDPILTPSAQLTFFDWAYVGVESIFDLTKGNGKRGDYGNRAGKWTTLDAIVGLSHEFELTDGIGLSVDFNYIYEYLRRHRYHNTSGADKDMGDTQYVNLELSLGDLWFEPTLGIERDLMADDGTYVNLEVGHTFALVGDEEDPTLTFRLRRQAQDARVRACRRPRRSDGHDYQGRVRVGDLRACGVDGVSRLQRLLVRLEAPRRRACLQRRVGLELRPLLDLLRRDGRHRVVLTASGSAGFA